MKSKKGSYRRLRRWYWQLSCHTGIETLPVSLWFKIHETGNIALLRKWWMPFVDTGKVWEGVYDEFIARIGLNGNYLKYLENIKLLTNMQYDCILAPTAMKRAQLTIKIEELNKEKATEKVDHNKIIAAVSRANGGTPLWRVSVLEFYSFMKLDDGK